LTQSKIALKMAEVALECGYVQKDGKNTYHKYKYASAEAVLKKVNKALGERKIAVSSRASLPYFRVLETDKNLAVVHLTLTFVDGESGETHVVEGMGSGVDSGDKAVMKATTAAHKYAYATALVMSWGDDPEADPPTDTPTTKKKRTRGPKKGTPEWIAYKLQGDLTPEALNELKKDILKLRGSDDYDTLRNAWKEKESNG